MVLSGSFFVEQIQDKRSRIDPIMVALLFVLVVVGLGMLWSASWFRAQQLYGEPLRFVLRQGLWVVVGLAAMAVAAVFPLRWVRRALPALVFLSLAVSLLTFVPGISARYMGARRWIILFNVSFQPSELVKLTMIVYLAHIFSRREGDFSDPMHSLVPPVLIVSLFSGIVLLQNDFSTAVFLVAVAMVMFFIAGVPIGYFVKMFVLVVPIGMITLFAREHRVRRIISFLNPEYDPIGSGFQVLAARRALEAGGFWGVGIGRSERKFGGLPEAQSDFLFAVLGEELGFIGVTIITGLFLLFAARGLYLARRQDDWFRSLLIFGLTASIAFQALLNIAVVAGAVPATGIPLPFFSAGGSSLLITFAMCGLILNAASDRGAAANQSAGGSRSYVWEDRRV